MTSAEHDVTLYELQRHAEEAADRIACVASDLLALADVIDAENQHVGLQWIAVQLRRKAQELAG
jgi:hypothetical protein